MWLGDGLDWSMLEEGPLFISLAAVSSRSHLQMAKIVRYPCRQRLPAKGKGDGLPVNSGFRNAHIAQLSTATRAIRPDLTDLESKICRTFRIKPLQ